MVRGHVHLDQVIQREGLTPLLSPATCFDISNVSQMHTCLAGPSGCQVVRANRCELSTHVLSLLEGRADAV
jgi:hypothetical protein